MSHEQPPWPGNPEGPDPRAIDPDDLDLWAFGPDEDPEPPRRRWPRRLAVLLLAVLVVASSAYVAESLLGTRTTWVRSGPTTTITAPIVTTTTAPPPVEVAALLDAHAGAVWKVEVEGCRHAGYGTAWAIDPRHLVTNAHVVQIDSSPLLTTRDGTQQRGTVIGRDDELDVAVIAVDLDLANTLDWAAVDDLEPGQHLLALGHPVPGDFTATTGDLAGFVVEDGRRVAVVTDARLEPGNSGGPLLTHDGRVAGVITRSSLEEDEPRATAYTKDAFGPVIERMITAPVDMEPTCEFVDEFDTDRPELPAPEPAPTAPPTTLAPCPSGRTVVTVTDAEATGSTGPDGPWTVTVEGIVRNETTAAIHLDSVVVTVTGEPDAHTAVPRDAVLAPSAETTFALETVIETEPGDRQVQASLGGWGWNDAGLGHCPAG